MSLYNILETSRGVVGAIGKPIVNLLVLLHCV